MKICHVCNAECEDTVELCPVCGAELDRKEETTEEEAPVMNNPTKIATVSDIVSAEIFKDVLKDSGIPFVCSSEMGDNSIQVLFGGGFVSEEFFVDEKDFEAASLLYEQFQSSESELEGDFETEQEEQ